MLLFKSKPTATTCKLRNDFVKNITDKNGDLFENQKQQMCPTISKKRLLCCNRWEKNGR